MRYKFSWAIKFLAIILTVNLTIPVHASTGRTTLQKTQRYTESLSENISKNVLAPDTNFAPLYKIRISPSSNITGYERFIIEGPGEGTVDEFYDEVVELFLAYSIDRDVVEEPFNTFIEESLKIRTIRSRRSCMSRPVKKGGAYYVLYSPQGDLFTLSGNEVLKFSEIEKPLLRDQTEGIIIMIDNGEKGERKNYILIEREPLTEENRKYFKDNRLNLRAALMAQTVTNLIAEGKQDAAISEIFTNPIFMENEIITAFSEICNNLIEIIKEDKNDRFFVRAFLRDVVRKTEVLCEDLEKVKAIDNIAGQTLIIISAIREGIKDVKDMRVTYNPEDMLEAEKEKNRGLSYIDKWHLPGAMEGVNKEGAPGPYDRGEQSLKKLGENILEELVYNETLFRKALSNVDIFTMYRMLHGLEKVPDGLIELTEKGLISTYHKTLFLRDFVPGSFQTTSTGPGHFQGLGLDIKQVTRGSGIQFNVVLNSDGTIKKVIAQYVKKGDFFFALPGCVDYIVDLGNLDFSDFSMDLSPGFASKFNDAIDFNSKETIDRLKSIKPKIAPYIAAVISGRAYLIGNMEELPELTWVGAPDINELIGSGDIDKEDFSLLDLYRSINTEENTWEDITGDKSILLKMNGNRKIPGKLDLLSKEKLKEIKGNGYLLPSFAKEGNILDYIESNEDFLIDILKREIPEEQALRAKLIRIPIDFLETDNAENVIRLINDIQNTANGYVELYSTENIKEIKDSVYKGYEITRKELPGRFNKNRGNTITLFPIFKREAIKTEDIGIGNNGGLQLDETILLPTGMSYDASGIIRNIIFGLNMTEIARGEADDEFISKTLTDFQTFCENHGIKDFELTSDDITTLVTGRMNDIVIVLNKLITYMPIMPLNPEEIRHIYDNMHEVLKKA